MRIAPVISIHIPFGGDNHADSGLHLEAAHSVRGVATIGELWSQLQANGLQDHVTFLSLNVFGRPLSPPNDSGRAHNPNHHVALMFGSHFRGSVIGGVEPFDNDYGATSIDPRTGASVPHQKGQIRFDETLQSMALTFGGGVGLDSSVLSQAISGGQIVEAALAPA
jgi:hypothetical protein